MMKLLGIHFHGDLNVSHFFDALILTPCYNIIIMHKLFAYICIYIMLFVFLTAAINKLVEKFEKR